MRWVLGLATVASVVAAGWVLAACTSVPGEGLSPELRAIVGTPEAVGYMAADEAREGVR